MKKILLLILITSWGLFAAPMMLELPNGATPNIPAIVSEGSQNSPPSNAIGDIEYNAENGDIWISTGNGLAVSRDGGATWETKLSGKGFSALAVLGEWIFAAESYSADDPADPDGSLPAGNGFYASWDNGATFTHIDSFVDQDVRRASRIGQLAYDIAIVPEGADTGIYAACFYGGLLYSPDGGQSWEELIVDGSDSLQFNKLAHRFFSVAVDSSVNPPVIWAGSAKGLFAGSKGDFAWDWHDVNGHWIPDSVPVFDTIWVDVDSFVVDSVSEFNVAWNLDLETDGEISGNWIISIDFLYGAESTGFFGSTRSTGDDGGYDAISYTFDNGSSWDQTGDSYVAWNMGFTGDTLWTATTHGLSRIFAPDYNYADTVEISGTDLLTNLPVDVLNDEVVSVTYCNKSIYVGTYTEGVAIAPDSMNYEEWFILAHFPEPSVASEQAGFDASQEFVYVFPNPYSPRKHGSCFFVFEPQDNYFVESDWNLSIELYDYDIKKICTIASYDGPGIADFGPVFEEDKKTRIQWNGLLDDGTYPENGLYFYRITTPDGDFWGKLMVVK